MKRRKFIQNLGIGAAPLAFNQSFAFSENEKYPTYFYKQPTTLQEAISAKGEILVRIEFSSDKQAATRLKSSIKIKKGKIARSKSWFFEAGEDEFISDSLQTTASQSNSDVDVLVLWLNEFSEETELIVKGEGKGRGKGRENEMKAFRFTLRDLVKNLEADGKIGETSVSANFLLDREIGEINPIDVGIEDSGEDFVFLIMADPQGADTSDDDPKRMRSKIHNAFVEESVRLANNLKVKPAFCLMLGDIVDYQGEQRDFAQMARFFEKLEMPVLYEMGNHESKYNTSFKPGYNLSGFNNYFAAQKALNGMDKLLYSFNLGKWHFVVWPDPLRKDFWENHPHYFDWLEQDLEKYKNRPTVFFQHIPMHPVGINPLINYAESVPIKRLLFELLAKHGNVKIIYSGHVHIPVKASFKTAVSHGGIQCINLPAAGYRPRAFGEADFTGGPSQGFAIVEVQGEKLKTTYKTITHEEYIYPNQLKEFEKEKYPLWFNYKWELPAATQILNGNFSEGLKNWGRRFVYHEDAHSSNLCEVRMESVSGQNALYLKTSRRGFCTPGQDRLPQDINRTFQAIHCKNLANPVLEFDYFIDGKNCDFEGWNGAYVWLEGFNGSTHVLNLMYFINKAWVNAGGTYGKEYKTEAQIFALDNSPDQWHRVQINMQKDFEKNSNGKKYSEIHPDKIVLSLGMWNINHGSPQPFACYFTRLQLNSTPSVESNVGGSAILLAQNEIKWWRGKNQPNTNIAGEHHYFTEGLNKVIY